MIFTRGVWPIRQATIWFEPTERIRPFLRGFARVHVYSYEPLSLPGFRLIKQKKTPVIPVAGKAVEDILATFRDTTRNEIRRTFHTEGLSFSIEGPSEELYAFYAAATRSQDRVPQKRDLFRDARVAVARKGDAIIATVAFVPAEPVAKVLTISSLRRESIDPQERNLIGFCSKRLIYELCAFAMRERYESVDLAYVNLEDPSKKGINDFKTGFGGAICVEYQYERVAYPYQLALMCRRG